MNGFPDGLCPRCVCVWFSGFWMGNETFNATSLGVALKHKRPLQAVCIEATTRKQAAESICDVEDHQAGVRVIRPVIASVAVAVILSSSGASPP